MSGEPGLSVQSVEDVLYLWDRFPITIANAQTKAAVLLAHTNQRALCHAFISPFEFRSNICDDKTAVNYYELVAYHGRGSITFCFSSKNLILLIGPFKIFGHKNLNFENIKFLSKNLGPLKKVRKKLAPLIFLAEVFQTHQKTLRASIPH